MHLTFLNLCKVDLIGMFSVSIGETCVSRVDSGMTTEFARCRGDDSRRDVLFWGCDLTWQYRTSIGSITCGYLTSCVTRRCPVLASPGYLRRMLDRHHVADNTFVRFCKTDLDPSFVSSAIIRLAASFSIDIFSVVSDYTGQVQPRLLIRSFIQSGVF